METKHRIRPFLPSHPGSILKEELRERGIKQKAFAEQIGMQPSHLNALLQGGRNITPQLALRLEEALNIPAHVWMNLQQNYNIDRIRPAELVAGYNPKTSNASYALAQPGPEDNPVKMYRAGYKDGQADLLEEILSHLSLNGYSREEALWLIGKKVRPQGGAGQNC